MYLTYEEYQKYGGTLDETAFNSLGYDVQVKIDYYTFSRLKKDTEYSEAVKRAFMKIMGLLDTHNKYLEKVADMDSPMVASASNDGVSESYGGYAGNTTPNDVSTLADMLEKDIQGVIREYLNGERNQKGELLLYRGVY